MYELAPQNTANSECPKWRGTRSSFQITLRAFAALPLEAESLRSIARGVATSPSDDKPEAAAA